MLAYDTPKKLPYLLSPQSSPKENFFWGWATRRLEGGGILLLAVPAAAWIGWVPTALCATLGPPGGVL